MKKNDDKDDFNVKDDDDFDMDDFNLDDDPFDPKKRTPAQTAAKYSIAFGKKASSEFGKGVYAKVSQAMPDTASLVSDSIQVKNDIMGMKDDISSQMGGIITDSKKALSTFLPYAKKFLPSSMYDKVEQGLKAEETHEEQQQSQSQKRESLITSEMSSIFAKQAKTRRAELNEERGHRIYDMLRGEQHQKANVVGLKEIRHELRTSNAFMNSAALTFMKKSLALKYQHLFVAQDSLEVSKTALKILSEHFPKITHNTAMPEFVKINKSEMLKEEMLKRSFSGLSNVIGNFIPATSKALAKTITDKLKETQEGIKEIADTLDMVDGDMMEEMTDPYEDLISTIGSWFGGKIGQAYGEKGKKHFGASFNRGETKVKNYKEKGYRELLARKEDWSSNYGSGWDFLNNLMDELMPSQDSTVSFSKQDLLKKPFAPAVFDISTRHAIVEIIPGILFKSLKQLTDIATGRSNEELAFNHASGNFDSRTQVFEQIKKSAFVNESSARKVSDGVGRLRGMHLHSTNGSRESFDTQVSKIKRFMFNFNNGDKSKVFRIKEFTNFKNDPTTITNYIKEVYEGIEDPHTLNDIIIDMVSTDGIIDEYKVDDFYNIIIETGRSQQHINKLKEFINVPSYARLFDDFGVMENRTSATSKLNNDWMERNSLKNSLGKDKEKDRIGRGEENYLYARKEYEEQILAQKRNNPNHIDSPEDSLELERINKLLGESSDTARANRYEEPEKQKFKIKPRFNDDTYKQQSGSSSSVSGIVTVANDTVDKIYEFLIKGRPDKDKKSEDKPFQTSILEKLDFLNENMFLVAETVENNKSTFTTGAMPSCKSSIDELKEVLSIHAAKSNDDRLKMLEYLAEIALFNYHEGNLDKAKDILNRTRESFFPEGAFGRAMHGLKDLSLGGIGMLRNLATFVNPSKIFNKLKNVYQDVRATDENPDPSIMDDVFKLQVGMAKLAWSGIKIPFKVAAFPFKMLSKFRKNGKNKFTDNFKTGRTKHSKPSGSKVPQYFDVYKAGTATVVLFEEVQKDGVLLLDGSELKASVDITQPVISKNAPNNSIIMIITQKDIDDGLTDVNGNSLKELAELYYAQNKPKEETNPSESFDWSKIGDHAKKIGSGVKELFKGAGKGLGMFATPFNTMAFGGMKLGGNILGGAADMMFGKKEDKQNRLLRRIDMIIELLDGTPPDDYSEEDNGLWGKIKKTGKETLNKMREEQQQKADNESKEPSSDDIPEEAKQSFWDMLKNSRFGDETGSVDMSALHGLKNIFKKKKKGNKPLKEEIYDMLKDDDLDEMKDFYADRYADSSSETEKDNVLQSRSNSLLERILESIRKLVKIEEKANTIIDKDGDGEHDKKKFGWGKIGKKIKTARDGKDGKDGKSKHHGMLSSFVKGVEGKKPGDNDDDDSFLGDVASNALGGAIGAWLGAGGGAVVLGLVKTALGAIAGGIGAVISSPAVLGAGLLGLGALVTNKASAMSDKYSGVSVSGVSNAIFKNRRTKYAINLKDADDKWVLKLEQMCLGAIENNTPVSLSLIQKSMMIKDAGLDLKNIEHQEGFEKWFNLRFIPVLKQYHEILRQFGVTYYQGNMLLKDDKRAPSIASFVGQIQVPDNSIILSDKMTKSDKVNPSKMIKDPNTGLLMPDDGLTAEARAKKNADLKEKFGSTFSADKTPWYKRSGFQMIKDQMSQNDLAAIEYDPKYKFEGDEAKLFEKTKAWIKGHEGLSLRAYTDSKGFNTIGYGHLNTEGRTKITKADADKLFDMDMDIALKGANELPEYSKLDPVRRMAILDLVFNMGKGKFAEFVKARKLLVEGKFPEAAAEVLRSDYAGQVGKRAQEVASLIKTGNPSYMKPRMVQVSKDDQSLLSTDDMNALSNMQFNDVVGPQKTPAPTVGTITAKPPTSTNGINPSTGLPNPASTTPVSADGSSPRKEYSDSYKTADSGVNMAGLDPSMRSKFEMMAQEYQALTGKPINVVSAHRSVEKQARMHAADPDNTAAPGNSLHNYGYAMDIDPAAANFLASKGLLEKYGFNRPFLHAKGKRKAEPWHIQPIGIDQAAIIAANKSNTPVKANMVASNAAPYPDVFSSGIAGQAANFGMPEPQKVSVAAPTVGTPPKIVPKVVEPVVESKVIASSEPTVKPVDHMAQLQSSISNIKVDASSKDTVSEISKTNKLLTDLINIFSPIAEMMKKQTLAMATPQGSNKSNSSGGKEAIQSSSTMSSVINPQRRG